MSWGYVPDSVESSVIIGSDITRLYAANAFNPMYYTPDTQYIIPPFFDTSGSEVQLSTQYTNAPINGFRPGDGTLDLSNYYRPTGKEYRMPSGSHNQLNGPTNDFRATITFNSNETKKATSAAGIEFEVTRSGNSGNRNYTCKILQSGPVLDVTGFSCARNNNEYTARTPAYYYSFDSTLTGCNNTKSDTDCYKLVFVADDEKDNFAIWYSFYRTRALATLSATSMAFAQLSPAVRLGWQDLARCTKLNGGNAALCKDNKFRQYDSLHKGQFYSWLKDIYFNSGTPLPAAMKRAGEFFKEDVAWHKYPNSRNTSEKNTKENTYACRASYHILMTDGMWNATTDNPSSFRHDNATFTLPDGEKYTGQHPYQDNKSSTLADLAMHYWATDLRSGTGGLPNELKPYVHTKNTDPDKQYWDPRNDPATWQHMTNFIMGLGLTSTLNSPGIPWAGSSHQGAGYEALTAGTKSWPEASSGSDNNVYDLWHAAINSRGEFFSVDSPETMIKAFKDILNRIADRTTTAARPAVSASFVTDNAGGSLQSNVYATQFSSEDWSGELSKTKLAAGQTEKLWTSTTQSPENREILMAGAETTSSKLKAFNWSNLGDLQGLLDINPESLVGAKDNRGADRVNYIRGNRSLEGDSETSFRRRNSSTVIGDIINSSPVVVGTPAYLAYLADAIEESDRSDYKSYASFREANRKAVTDPDTGAVSGRKEMIYVGGNDGMLHGFNAATGIEEFAFIPTEVIKNLYRLTGKNYSGGEHHYFVDGTPIVRDVYLSDDEGWRTVLIGTLRAGGKALFALDITDPGNIKLLWEFDSTTDEDLGYTFAQPEIVRLHTGEWAVLQGNGYDSTNDRAALLIINIKTGELIKKILVPEEVADNGITLPNGLSSVRGADNNGDGLVDYAYAGDLQGNLWRFDLVRDFASEETSDPFSRTNPEVASTSKNDFKLAYGGKPLFTARDSKDISRQPITIQPSLVRHPSSHGYLVLVGTGKYFEHSDANVDTSRAMTLYGIWDRNTKRQATSATTLRAEERDNLLMQSFSAEEKNAAFMSAEEAVTATRDIRLLSSEVPQWYKTPAEGQPPLDTRNDVNVNHWGWALDMAVGSKLEGEMIINNMTASGSILFLSSLTPNQDPCQAGADTWLYAVDAFSGGRTRFNVLDLNADKIVDKLDQYTNNVVSGMRFPALGGFTLAPGNQVFGSDGAADPATVGDDPNSSGRQSWHIVPEKYQ
ncbi:pilus assembly protein PilY [Pseudomonas stutzeri]|nr:pilus assembly protein PilY [Stutzerimonas stutzeri]